ncbi:unnamed protein product [Ambrosiozyma monospora]|uniref:Unnamed protein product n=1 Tax=Ambrosiozyma monospora TaxID=43982 RepID=A0A9W6STQ3_AMBMO|nr:unnamed protein product [Ambrosiozyma monospora]
MLYNKDRFNEMYGYEYDGDYNPDEDFEVSTNSNKFGYTSSPAITSDSMFIGNGSINGQSPNIGGSGNFLTASNANNGTNGTTSRSRSPLPSSQGFTKNLSSFSPSISTDSPTRVVQPSKPLVNPSAQSPHSSSSDNITTPSQQQQQQQQPRSTVRRPTITINDEIPTVGSADISDSDDDSIYSATKGLQISGSVNSTNGNYTNQHPPHTETINSNPGTTTTTHPIDSNAPLNFSTDSFGTTSVSASAQALYGSTAKFNNGSTTNYSNAQQYNYSADSVYSHGSSNYGSGFGSGSRVGSLGGHRNGSVHNNNNNNVNVNGNASPSHMNYMEDHQRHQIPQPQISIV